MRTLLIIFSVFYGLRLLIRFVFPWLVRFFLRKRMTAFHQGSVHQNEARKEGDVSIKTNAKRKQDHNDGKGLGDYVNFEEVDDK